MSKTFTVTVLACVVPALLAFGERRAHAQGRDGLLNGAVIGAAVGAGLGVALTHAVRDSDLVFSQYARGALIFGAIGAGVGLGVDALLNRASPGSGATPRRVLIAPIVYPDVAGVVVQWRWSPRPRRSSLRGMQTATLGLAGGYSFSSDRRP